MFEPTVRGNIETLSRRTVRLGNAPLGPVSLGPGEGHIRAHTGAGDTFRIDTAGAQFAFRGEMTGLTPHLESLNSTVSQQGEAISSKADTTYVDGVYATVQLKASIAAVDAKNASQDSAISAAQSRADSAWFRANEAYTNAGTAQSRADAAHSRAGTGIADAATAQARADAAWLRANEAFTNAGTAQSRADSAYSRAGTGIADAANARDLAIQAANSVQALRSEVHQWMQQARANDPSLPPPIPN